MQYQFIIAIGSILYENVRGDCEILRDLNLITQCYHKVVCKIVSDVADLHRDINETWMRNYYCVPLLIMHT
jgi:hypothetical protein